MERSSIFENGPIPAAVFKNVIPAVITMLVVVIYNIADTFFVGQTGNELQVAAVSLTTPVFLLFMAIGSLFGVGGTSLISRAFGQKRPDYARQICSFCFYGCIVAGILMGALFLLNMSVILRLIGASEATASYARDYLTYVAMGAPAVMVVQAFSSILRAEGKAKQAMFGSLLGTAVNIILDPIMILSMDMGVIGAAIATVIGNVCAAFYYIWYFLSKKSHLSISIGDFRWKNGIFTGVFAVGIPATLNSVLMSFSNVVMNNFLSGYGDAQVAAMGVAMKANMLLILLQIGIAQGVQPLLGFNYGAKNYKRASGILRFATLCAVIFGSLLSVGYYFGADSIIHAFIDNTAVIGYGIPMLRAIMLPGPVIGILFILTSSLQAMGKALPSLVLSLSRQGLVFIPGLFILNALAGLTGIVYAQPAADFASIVIAAALYYHAIHKPGVKHAAQVATAQNLTIEAEEVAK